jgi:glutamyl-tRNA synthetase
VIRFLNPTEGSVKFNDLVKGDIEVSNNELDDLIIRRTDGSPTYNLTVVVDDHDMEITQVIRGDDHINNTPRQINMYQAMGWSVPEFAHLPMILGDDGARLSKRHGAVSVMQYADDGYLPEGLLNYLVRLGWSHGDQELFSREEMIKLFELTNVNRAPSAFNTEKLNWLNAHYIKEASPEALAPLLQKHLKQLDIEATDLAVLAQIVEAQRERASTLVELAEISTFYFNDPEGYSSKPAKKALVEEAISPLTHARDALAQLAAWEREPIHQCVADSVAALEIGFGKLAMPLRISVTDGAPSPDLDLTLYLVGREATLRRIDNAIAFIQENAS